jgi:hypothetical protein
MPDHYFHYTSRHFAQSIFSAGRIQAGPSGVIYLSRDVFERGAEAMSRLAIEGKSIDMVGLVPGNLVTPGPDEPVLPILDAMGRIWRRGGGTQVRVKGPIASDQIKWFAVSGP